MHKKLSLWLTAIIVLTLAAFLFVFKPITFSARKDPSDASLYLKPVGAKSFHATSMPDPTFSLGERQSFNVYLYTPQHDLRLGLDLRGGMRVVLQIPDRSTFTYPLKQKLAGQADATDKQQELRAVLAGNDYLGEVANDDKQVEVTVNEQQAEIVTTWKNESEAQAQFEASNRAMAKVFGQGQFVSPRAKDLLDSEAIAKQRKETQESVRNIMENRMNGSGMTEVVAYAKGKGQVVLEIPGVKDPDHVREMIGKTASMQFRLVPAGMSVSVDDETGDATASRGGQILEGPELINATYLVITGKDLKPNSDIVPDQKAAGKMAVSFEMRDKSKAEKAKRDQFAALTAGSIGRQLMIVLDDAVVMAPVIEDRLPGEGIITGHFAPEEAKDLATLLNAGALPVPVDIVETRTVSATLGADSVSMSMTAGIIGLIAVLVFMIGYYRLPGMMASIALIIYIFLSLGALMLFKDTTLTLPGIAGIILSIGMAVDANVIIFERLKEELRTKKPLSVAIDVAFARAWTAILDSNVASLITGSVLYWLGTGAVRGFAVTLMIGVAVSMFTAVTVTRLLMKLMIRSKAGHNLAWYGV